MNTARFTSTLLTVTFGLVAAFTLWQPANCTAGTYTVSAHGSATDGVSRSDLNTRTSATGGQDYNVGNCAHCHEQHASVGGSEPSPTGGPDNYLGMDPEQDFCLECHGNGGNDSSASAGAPDDIKTDIDKTGGRHNVYLSDTAHRAHETITDIKDDKHIECTDCHNPHAAGTTLHHTHDGTQILDPITSVTTHTNAIATTSPLYKATGIEANYTGIDSNWGNDNIDYGDPYSAMQTATKEYQICFKCHTKANISVESWGDPADPAMAWTDVGMEFNPYNKSFHPVVSGLSGGVSGSSALNPAQLIAPWNVDVGTQTMYCTDCHESDSGLAGPHGSAVKWMLAGTNKAWPYCDKGKNGRQETGTYRTLGDMDLDINTSQGTFCRNCHPNDVPTSPVINDAHDQTNHSGTACVDCHIRIPHGGRVSRLIAADNSDTYTMPDRYTSDGAGDNTDAATAPKVRKFIKTDATDYSKGNCYSTAGECDGTSAHGPDITGESW